LVAELAWRGLVDDLNFHVKVLFLDMVFSWSVDLDFDGFERLLAICWFEGSEIYFFVHRLDAENVAVVHKMKMFGVDVFVLHDHLFPKLNLDFT
jgi:hypothetical protein